MRCGSGAEIILKQTNRKKYRMIPHGFAQAWCTLTTYMMGYDFPRQKISSRVEKKQTFFLWDMLGPIRAKSFLLALNFSPNKSMPRVPLQDLARQPGCTHVFHKLDEFVKGHAPTVCRNPKMKLHGSAGCFVACHLHSENGRITSDAVKVPTVLVAEFSCVVIVVGMVEVIQSLPKSFSYV